MKFVMSQAVCDESMSKLDGIAEVYVANDGDPNNYIEEMKDADAIIIRIAKMDKQAILNSSNLKVIGRTGVGYDSVDVETATLNGIPVVITPGANNRAVAEHAVGMIFAISKNLVEGHIETAKGNFAQIRGVGKAFELKDKKIGFIGLGSIGRETAKICQGIGMKTGGYDPYLQKEQVEAIGCSYYSDYRTLIAECDIVSIHVPLTVETKDLIGMDEMRLMKKTSILVNCSRGGIVNEADLTAALNQGIIAGAGTDVFENEPPSIDHPLLCAKNLVYSPHSAAQTKEAVLKMHEMCVDGCLAIIRGEQWPHVADRAVYKHPKWIKAMTEEVVEHGL